MKTPNITTKKIKDLFFYLLLLTGLFCFFEAAYFFETTGFHLADFSEISFKLTIPKNIIPPLLFFISMQVFIHIVFMIAVGVQSILFGMALNFDWKKIEKISILLWIINLITILIANQYFYPNSKFSELTGAILTQQAAGICLFFLCAALIAISLISLFQAIKLFFTHQKIIFFLLISLIITTSCFWFFYINRSVTDGSSEKTPNIILIGIDSLRPDFLGFFSSDHANTYHLDSFLNQSTVFSESLTPLARTFPAWIAILTGNYPKKSGARTDLEKPEYIDLRDTLPLKLKEYGYHTIFSTDETRFSNIDKPMGFDEIISPPIGASDFLLGSLNDFPLSNLIVNTQIGSILFPHSFGNRPAIVTYDPNSFLTLLKPTLKTSRNKPVFLAIHFCLPHFPYVWKQQKSEAISAEYYSSAVQRVDQQVNDFLTLLKKNNFLDHAIVVILSDHGEALNIAGDRITSENLFVPGKLKSIPRFYPPMIDNEAINKSVGHGTDVLGLSQYHTLLAFRLYGFQKNHILTVSERVSLLDIRPTILRLIGLPSGHTAGRSLANHIIGEGYRINDLSDFFTESDFSPQAIRTVHPETKNILFAGINYYEINPHTLRVVVKDDMLRQIISSKQFADFYGHWVLALYPQSKQIMIPVLVDLDTGQWTSDLATPFAKKSPVSHMLLALKTFYREETQNMLIYPESNTKLGDR